jgi:hypothetical protein
MQALSGLQVLLMLDTLSGFIQLSLAKEDKEKTRLSTSHFLLTHKMTRGQP